MRTSRNQCFLPVQDCNTPALKSHQSTGGSGAAIIVSAVQHDSAQQRKRIRLLPGSVVTMKLALLLSPEVVSGGRYNAPCVDGRRKYSRHDHRRLRPSRHGGIMPCILQNDDTLGGTMSADSPEELPSLPQPILDSLSLTTSLRAYT
ncbi:hypothetical protein J6590_010635 [Homalodisca vitripennis]|nr:hypothetical protein J6590_010635 [Homalodisca vitripennis]